MPPKFNEPLFDHNQVKEAAAAGRHLAPIVLVPPSDPKMPAAKNALLIYPPEAGYVVQRDGREPSAGAYDFVPIHKLGRPLKAGDNFGWRAKMFAANGEPKPYFAEMFMPAGPKIYTREQRGRWAEHMLKKDRNVPVNHRDTVYHDIVEQRTKPSDPVGWSLTTYVGMRHVANGVSHGHFFWTVQPDDPNGIYEINLYTNNKKITTFYFEVKQ